MVYLMKKAVKILLLQVKNGSFRPVSGASAAAFPVIPGIAGDWQFAGRLLRRK